MALLLSSLYLSFHWLPHSPTLLVPLKSCIPFPQNIHLLIFYIFRLFLLPSLSLHVYSVGVNSEYVLFFWTAWEQVADMLSSLLIIQVYISPKEGHSLIEMSYNHAGQFHHYHVLLRLRLHIANCPHHCHFFLSFLSRVQFRVLRGG